MTTRFAVVGSPISHSLSPVLHNAAYKFLGLDFSYEKHEVTVDGLDGFLADSNFAGLSVTMPLKEEAFKLASWRDEIASLTEVANTLVRTTTGYSAYNTDVFGMQGALANVAVPNSVTILGSGATAKSALVAMSRAYPKAKVLIAARNIPGAESLVVFAGRLGLSAQASEPRSEVLLESELVISTVPQKAYGYLWEQLANASNAPSGTLFDVAYNPWPSVAASAWGAGSTVSGLEMLIWQAVRQVEIFAEAHAPQLAIDRAQLYSQMSKAVSAE